MVVPFGLLVLYRRRSRPVGSPVSTTEDGDAVSPNIVCVVCEDIGPWLHCFGDSVAVTPTIDALAAEGIRYTSIYGTVGVSAPSRAALITGMYPTHINANYMRTQRGRLHVHRR